MWPRIGDGNVMPAKLLSPVGKRFPGPISWSPSGILGLLNVRSHAVQRAGFMPPVANRALAGALVLHAVGCRPHVPGLGAQATLPLTRSSDHGGAAGETVPVP